MQSITYSNRYFLPGGGIHLFYLLLSFSSLTSLKVSQVFSYVSSLLFQISLNCLSVALTLQITAIPLQLSLLSCFSQEYHENSSPLEDCFSLSLTLSLFVSVRFCILQISCTVHFNYSDCESIWQTVLLLLIKFGILDRGLCLGQNKLRRPEHVYIFTNKVQQWAAEDIQACMYIPLVNSTGPKIRAQELHNHKNTIIICLLSAVFSPELCWFATYLWPSPLSPTDSLSKMIHKKFQGLFFLHIKPYTKDIFNHIHYFTALLWLVL